MRHRDFTSIPHVALRLVLWGAVGACRPAANPSAAPPTGQAVGPATPLVLALEEGERRLRRFGYSAPNFTIKVDRRNGGSGDLVMGYEDLPPGAVIPPHVHRMADEIVFVHRGSGVVHVGGRRTSFGTGATIYIPRDVRVTIENTGRDSLGIAFIFSKPGFEELLRDISVPEGQPLVPMTAAEMTAARKRHEWHTVYERP